MTRRILALALLSTSLIATACGPSAAATTTAPTEVRAATVYRGAIQQTMSYSGDVRAREQITVLPKASGRVQKVVVDVGSAVHTGDVLAELEQDSQAIQVLQARANLAAAQAKLATIQAGGKPDDVAAAREALAQQQSRFAAMQQQGRPEDVSAAAAALSAQLAKLAQMENGGRPEAVAQAQAALDAVEQKMALLQKGPTDDVRQAAASNVTVDTAQLAAAEASYAALGPGSFADLENLQGQVDALTAQAAAAQSAVASADAALSSQQRTSVADVQAAQTALDQAQAALSTAEAALNQANNPTQASIAQAQAALEQARAQRAAAESNQTALEQKASGVCMPLVSGLDGHTLKDQNGTACGVAKAAADAAIQAGDAAVEAAQGQLDLLRRGGAPATQTAQQAQVVSAQALVKATGARLDAVANGGIQAQRAQLQAQRDQAQSQLMATSGNLTTARARLTAAQNGAQDAQRKAAQAQVDAAREKLKADQARLDQIQAGPQDEEVQAAQDAVTQAMQQLAIAAQPATGQDVLVQRALVEQARQQLAKAQQPFTAFDLDQQQHVVAQAEAQVRTREQPFTDQDVQAAQAGVDQAQAALELARLGVKETQILAPVDGIVFDRQVSPGALVGPQSPIVVLIPPSLEVVVNVEEAQLGRLSKGQPVALQVVAYPEDTFTGRVAAIAPAIDQKTRTASVRVEPQDDSGRLRPGMLANVRIMTGERSDALLVPRDAVIGTPASGAQATVFTIANGRAERASVRLGLVDEQVVEIQSGLSDGQVVVVGKPSGLNSGDAVLPQLRTALAAVGAN
jgi:RND family efflux transporter MFP subunit